MPYIRAKDCQRRAYLAQHYAAAFPIPAAGWFTQTRNAGVGSNIIRSWRRRIAPEKLNARKLRHSHKLGFDAAASVCDEIRMRLIYTFRDRVLGSEIGAPWHNSRLTSFQLSMDIWRYLAGNVDIVPSPVPLRHYVDDVDIDLPK